MPSAAEPAKPGQHLAAGDLANFARAVLDDRLVERHLAVAGDGQLAVAADRKDRGRTNLHAFQSTRGRYPWFQKARRTCQPTNRT